MNWFFKKKKKSAPRGWEEITTPKKRAEDEEECVEYDPEEDDICEEEQSENVSEPQEEDRDSLKIPKKSPSKFSKRVESMDFDPTVYFGWGEGKVDEIMKKATSGWRVVASIFWFIFGSVTFAPVLFTASKLDKFFGDKKKSLVASAIIYFVFAVALVLLLCLR